ncbi:PilN domain-containing protein [Gilvimarinus sp. F26214L]|uniref:PilN domain-containing protein n=1 Tax=Gilvimarinus sp. DZF01 TaxID=3461371 RepID=UPI0040465B33
MARINLLPWRDEERQEKKKEFFTVLGGFCILGVLCGYVWVSTVQAAIDNQNSRNNLLQKEINALQQQVAEIKELKERRAQLLERMKVIQDLQGTRPVIVRYFDGIVRAVPDGVYLTKLVRNGDQISLDGIADSHSRISALMRNLDESDWFADPNMATITAAPGAGEQAQRFTMTVGATIPKQDDAEGGK